MDRLLSQLLLCMKYIPIKRSNRLIIQYDSVQQQNQFRSCCEINKQKLFLTNKNQYPSKLQMSHRKSHRKQPIYVGNEVNQSNQRGYSASRKLHYTNSNKKNHKLSSSSKKHPNGSISLKNKLIDFLVKAAEIQRKLQIIKETLCEEQSFTPGSVFHRIDKDRKGYVLQKDIERFLIQNKMQFKGSQLKILYGKMNVDQEDSGVELWKQISKQIRFQNFILPNQNPRLRYFTMRRPVYIPLSDEKLFEKVQWLMSKLFLQIMKEQAKLKEINATLISSYDFHPKTVFELLTNIQGFITGESLNNFMVNQNCEVSIEEIGCLIRLMDKRGEGRICLEDFKFFLATLGLKKQHEIFDELSPIPALKNFMVPQVKSIQNREGTLKQRVADNKMYRRTPEKGMVSSGKIKRSGGLSSRKINY